LEIYPIQSFSPLLSLSLQPKPSSALTWTIAGLQAIRTMLLFTFAVLHRMILLKYKLDHDISLKSPTVSVTLKGKVLTMAHEDKYDLVLLFLIPWFVIHCLLF
jgi:hypothetical protein